MGFPIERGKPHCQRTGGIREQHLIVTGIGLETKRIIPCDLGRPWRRALIRDRDHLRRGGADRHKPKIKQIGGHLEPRHVKYDRCLHLSRPMDLNEEESWRGVAEVDVEACTRTAIENGRITYGDEAGPREGG
jgi:hypothetical protein